ncbi:DUF732 domain-containing protein [Mycobacterium sp. 1081908.1]|uniref:DUF732 domain-containing protein n=1 Tax=Mycobacterium sp. 1081908.1 TaxID=1834066 RepID=UPI0007FBFECC|nr:DUF732 domain-containing protein [Mycobacterium sp. 1081908.1]OBK53524.1 hypothetical protein A5655_19350 [Mycobacterium sp. 1081908.1]
MRDREAIDQELRLIALGRQSIRAQGARPSIQDIDALLDERLGHPVEVALTEAVDEVPVPTDTSSPRNAPHGRKRRRRRFVPLAALPLSLLAVAAAVVAVMFGTHRSDPDPPSAAPPESAVPPPSAVTPPSGSQPSPAAPVAHVPQLEIVDRAYIGALKQDGVPVPSNEYVTTHGHAVCEFLANQPDFAEAVRVLQQSSIWDANQSASVAAGAVVAYCPQYQPSSLDHLQPRFQDALSGLQAIERDLQGIQGNLQDIREGLPPLPGQ